MSKKLDFGKISPLFSVLIVFLGYSAALMVEYMSLPQCDGGFFVAGCELAFLVSIGVAAVIFLFFVVLVLWKKSRAQNVSEYRREVFIIALVLSFLPFVVIFQSLTGIKLFG